MNKMKPTKVVKNLPVAKYRSGAIEGVVWSNKSNKGEGIEKEFTIEDLPGVGAATAEKLKESGFDTMLSIAVASPGEIVDIAGVGEAVAKKIIKTARDQLKMGFESGTDLLKKREAVERITSNS